MKPRVSHIHPLALMGLRVNVMTSLQLVLSVVTRGHGKSKQMTGRGSFAIDLALIPRLQSRNLLP